MVGGEEKPLPALPMTSRERNNRGDLSLHPQPGSQETFLLQPNTRCSFIWTPLLSHSLTAGDENPQICPRSSVPGRVEKDNCLLWEEHQIGLWLRTLSVAEGSDDGGAYVQPSAMPSRGGWQMFAGVFGCPKCPSLKALHRIPSSAKKLGKKGKS